MTDTDKSVQALTPEEEQGLESLFAQARLTPPDLPPELMGRIIADAADVTATTKAQAPARRPAARRPWAFRLEWLGPAFVAASAVMGVSVGYASPDLLGSIPVVSNLSSAAAFDFDAALTTYDQGDGVLMAFEDEGDD